MKAKTQKQKEALTLVKEHYKVIVKHTFNPFPFGKSMKNETLQFRQAKECALISVSSSIKLASGGVLIYWCAIKQEIENL